MIFDKDKNSKDALSWCMLFEVGMIDDINEITSKGILYEFTFERKIY